MLLISKIKALFPIKGGKLTLFICLTYLRVGGGFYNACGAWERQRTLIFMPQAEGEKTLTFPCTFLKPDASYVPGMGEDHVARLVFKAIPDPETGKLFTFV